MPELFANSVNKMTPILTLTSGQILSVQVLNSDGTVDRHICDDAVPNGEIFTCVVSYSGTLAKNV